MARIVVTGGAGFIGSHIVDALLARKHDVHVLDDLSSGCRENLEHVPQVVFHKVDIRSASANDLLERLSPHIVVHAAAQISVRASMEHPALDTDVNVTGLVNMLSALKEQRGAHVVFLSSGGAIYGEQIAFPADEDHPVNPESVYGLSKRVGEEYLEFWNRVWGVTSTSLRLSNVYGPRQNPHGEAGVVAIFTQRLLGNQGIAINGTGEQTRDFVYVEDVAEAVGRAVDSRAHGIFNIGTGKETTILELARLIRAAIAPDAPINHVSAKSGEQMRSCIDNQRALRRLEWAPKIELGPGIQRTIDWFRDAKR